MEEDVQPNLNMKYQVIKNNTSKIYYVRYKYKFWPFWSYVYNCYGYCDLEAEFPSQEAAEKYIDEEIEIKKKGRFSVVRTREV